MGESTRLSDTKLPALTQVQRAMMSQITESISLMLQLEAVTPGAGLTPAMARDVLARMIAWLEAVEVTDDRAK